MPPQGGGVMEQLGVSKLWSFLDGGDGAVPVTNGVVRSGRGFRVGSYLELAARVAELQFRNRQHVLLFRGQGGDWRSVQGRTSIMPGLLRPPPGRSRAPAALIAARFETLSRAEALLAQAFPPGGPLGRQRVARTRLLRWSILQHYEICPTPLLDVTHSLRVAASFASLGGGEEAFLHVLAVPNLSGAVTVHAEGGLQVLRLASMCPPVAMRPHIQEGYLLGEYPELAGPPQGLPALPHEMDFGRRMVAKFRFEPGRFWADPAFLPVPREALYPGERDPLERIAQGIRAALDPLP
ncbi:FRG domain-containing protein [Pararoseomonas baculiformis]|nr:FRG domain-containing protein [Pararoseomonas baculiformis]